MLGSPPDQPSLAHQPNPAGSRGAAGFRRLRNFTNLVFFWCPLHDLGCCCFFFFFGKLLSAERPRPSAPGSPATQSLLPRSPVGVPFRTTLEDLVAAAHGTRGAARLAAAQVGRSARRVGRGSGGRAASGRGAGGGVWVVPT